LKTSNRQDRNPSGDNTDRGNTDRGNSDRDNSDAQAAFTWAALLRRRLIDRGAGVVFASGGIAVILSILVMLVFISYEVYPLFKSPTATLLASYDLSAPSEDPATSGDQKALEHPAPIRPQSSPLSFHPALALGVDEYREFAYLVTPAGDIKFVSLKTGKTVLSAALKGARGGRITSSSLSIGNRRFTLGMDNGRVFTADALFETTFDDAGIKTLTPSAAEGEPVKMADGIVRAAVSRAKEDGSSAIAAIADSGALTLRLQKTASSLLGEGKTKVYKHDLTRDLKGLVPTALALDSFLENLYAGTSDGKILVWDISAPEAPLLMEKINTSALTQGIALPDKGAAVTAMGMVLGERSLVVGDEAGGVAVWFQVRDETAASGRSLRHIRDLAAHSSPVLSVSATKRNRTIITTDAQGGIILHHATNGRKLLQLAASKGVRPPASKGVRPPVRPPASTGNAATASKGNAANNAGVAPPPSVTPLLAAYAPKADGILTLDSNGTLQDWVVDAPHPEVSLSALFGRIWYEGYSRPQYMWQSSGSGDDFEPKLSLTPLIIGTFKGTFYALLYAVPLAILGAMCVSQFMHRRYAAVIKPSIEVMAAMPSVVIGFVAGLWLAPVVEKNIVSALMVLPVLMLLSLAAGPAWKLLPKKLRRRFSSGTEFFLLLPVFAAGIAFCLWIDASVEGALFAGDFKQWLYDVVGLRYDQRNALVVGFAMGFAVIPIIFTISEDALSSVPKNLISGSLAVGATKWQTTLHVVLPTASPGIFAAVMIGLGRAVGETMIVLMATGNTPVGDWNIFNGFRALSANLAVEMPEAPYAGTLYRVLFFSAMLLFALTFVVNTASEVVRIRLRNKYGKL
jgi:phosphate transport system permease protein